MPLLAQNHQYRVAPPLAVITAFILEGIEFTRSSIISREISVSHTCSRTSFSLFLLSGLCSATLRFITCHKCSIGFRSGEFAGQSSLEIPRSSNVVLS